MYCTKDTNRRHKIIKYAQDHQTLWPLLKATVNYQLCKVQIGVTSIELNLGSSGFQSLHECQEWIYCHSTSDAAKNVHQLIPFIVLLSTKKGFNSKCWWVPTSLDSTPVWTFSTSYLFHLPSTAPKRVIMSIFVHLLPQNLQSARFWYSLNPKNPNHWILTSIPPKNGAASASSSAKNEASKSKQLYSLSKVLVFSEPWSQIFES
jgi:hypothetical protein